MAALLTFVMAMACAGCGGGGGGGVEPTAASIESSTPAPTAPSTTATPPLVTTTESPPPLAADTISATVGVSRALGVAASLAMEGVSESPPSASGITATAGVSYFVDSRVGDDSHDGLSSSVAAAGRGPWRTLARVLTSRLAAGDALNLACGSVWNETLRLPASGVVGKPVVVSATAPGCATPPIIDGAVALAASGWTQHQGNIFKINLNATPLQLTTASTAVWTEAHHPNRGHLASDTTSPYLNTAADSEVITVAQQPASISIVTGSDLALPAGVQLAAGARIGIRLYSWWFEEHKITSVAGNKLGFDVPALFAITANRGYYLMGQLWMADSDGEWHHDAANKQLYAYMPGGVVPTAPLLATVLPIGIDLKNRDNVVIDGVAIRRTGVGVDLRDSKNVVIRNASLTDIAGIGADATGTAGATIESTAFTRTGTDAVSGWRPGYTMSATMTVRNNVIRESGVLMSGETVLSQPRLSSAAIYAGPGSTVSGNVIVNSGYIGILAQAGSLVEKNFVYGACTVLDDCGGIFTQYANNNNVIRGNTVVRTRGAIAGKPPGERVSQGQGIYMDESVTGTLVEDNTVIDAENGIFVHVSSHNIVRGNRLYGNRTSQIWMQADVNPDNPTRNVVDNLIVENLIAPISPNAVGIKLDTSESSTARFGTIDRNRYYDRASPVAVMQGTALGTSLYSMAGWQKAAAGNLPAGRDVAGTATSLTPYTNYRVTGGNLIPYGGAANYSYGWNPWNATAPYGQVTSGTCAAGPCLQYAGGGSPGQISSPNFSVLSGQWYRLSFDAAASSDGVSLGAVVRRGGGGSNSYDPVSIRNLPFTANRSWARYTTIFQSTVTINAHDPVTLDIGARMDISPIPVGQSITLANVELVAIVPDTTAALSGALINAGSSAKAWDCPFASSQPALCGKFRRLADDGAVGWPAAVPAYSAALIYAQEPTLLDTDGDGIADVDDRCPTTPAGTPVNAAGCPLTLR